MIFNRRKEIHVAVLGTTFPYELLLLLFRHLPRDVSKFFYNFASRSPILMIFTFLKMALKFSEQKISGGSGIRTHAYYEC